MTELKNLNKEAFDDYGQHLTGQGHAVMNPASLPQGFSQAEYMDICLAMLRACDEIHLLPGWKASPGACAEYAMATKLGMVAVFLT